MITRAVTRGNKMRRHQALIVFAALGPQCCIDARIMISFNHIIAIINDCHRWLGLKGTTRVHSSAFYKDEQARGLPQVYHEWVTVDGDESSRCESKFVCTPLVDPQIAERRKPFNDLLRRSSLQKLLQWIRRLVVTCGESVKLKPAFVWSTFPLFFCHIQSAGQGTQRAVDLQSIARLPSGCRGQHITDSNYWCVF